MKKKGKTPWYHRFKFWVEDEKEMATRPENAAESNPKEIGEKTEGGRTFFGVKWVWPFMLILLASCALPTTRFTYESEAGASMTVEMPKELEATNLSVEFDAKTGKATVKADKIQSKSKGLVEAEGQARTQAMEAASKAAGEAAAEAMKKMIMPVP